MDVWCPGFRHFRDGVTRITNDAGTLSVALGVFTASANATDTAGHPTPGGVWLDAYGEVMVQSMSIAGAKAGLWLRVQDASNYLAAYLTSTGANVDAVVAGVVTNLLTVAFTVPGTPGNLPFRAEVAGDTVTIYWRGAVVGQVLNTTVTWPGFVSLFLRSVSTTSQATANSFEVGPYVGAYSPPLNQQPGPRRTPSRLR